LSGKVKRKGRSATDSFFGKERGKKKKSSPSEAAKKSTVRKEKESRPLQSKKKDKSPHISNHGKERGGASARKAKPRVPAKREKKVNDIVRRLPGQKGGLEKKNRGFRSLPKKQDFGIDPKGKKRTDLKGERRIRKQVRAPACLFTDPSEKRTCGGGEKSISHLH